MSSRGAATGDWRAQCRVLWKGDVPWSSINGGCDQDARCGGGLARSAWRGGCSAGIDNEPRGVGAKRLAPAPSARRPSVPSSARVSARRTQLRLEQTSKEGSVAMPGPRLRLLRRGRVGCRARASCPSGDPSGGVTSGVSAAADVAGSPTPRLHPGASKASANSMRRRRAGRYRGRC